MQGDAATEPDGRSILITGGTSGLGLATAERFVRAGAHVVITGRDALLGTAAAASLASWGEVAFVRADAADPDQVRASVEATVARHGGLDVLVNNAGVAAAAGVLDTQLDTYDLIMDVNVRGAFCYANAAFPHLEASGGCMVHVASDAGISGEVEIAIYSVSKAALIMLSNMLAIEGARRGVRSNAVCPGDTAPGMRHTLIPGGGERPDEPSSWPLPPVGRIGEAMDVADAIVFLASERASFINGAALLIDGGMRAGTRTATFPDASPPSP